MRAESIIRDGKESYGGTDGEGEPERTGSSGAADVCDVVQRRGKSRVQRGRRPLAACAHAAKLKINCQNKRKDRGGGGGENPT